MSINSITKNRYIEVKEGRKVILEPSEASDWPAGIWDNFTPDPEFEIPKALSTKPFDLDEPTN